MTEEELIKQLSKDYDIDYHDVKYLRENNPNDFYKSLNKFIKNRDEMNLHSKLKKIVKRNMEKNNNE